mgnify:CR=1 FL=1
MTSSRFLLIPVVALAVLALNGCVKDVSSPPPSRGLSTIPFYDKGSYAFSTSSAEADAQRVKEEEAKRKEEISTEVKKRVEAAGVSIPFDPWVPPVVRKPYELPQAIRGLPKDKFGYPDWSASFAAGLIKPSSSIEPGGEWDQSEGVLDMDVVFIINDRLMANVKFPHKTHTQILSCANCHPSIFKEKKGANKFTMYDIWNGEYCGRCHGKVAFQPKGFENCQRCHSLKKTR